ncbi:glucitol operon activator protein [Vagococcus fluvialis]|uniref:transcriptional regulator GutM n=1 Tax=Vagococcus fluvialis TaxID=2738 RepID=UPI000E021357|nr:transcriptional regulator GutM [Vagococcus fluvialis]RCX12614.1 glucitol operon activator protein [Vagococcus fluvialis]
MEYWGIIFLLVSCWLLQILLSIMQQRHYFKKMNELKKNTDGHLGVGISKSKFNLGPGIILIITTSEDGKISNYYIMNGISTFSRFRNKEKFINHLPSELPIKNKKEQNAFKQALELINKERSKQALSHLTV